MWKGEHAAHSKSGDRYPLQGLFCARQMVLRFTPHSTGLYLKTTIKPTSSYCSNNLAMTFKRYFFFLFVCFRNKQWERTKFMLMLKLQFRYQVQSKTHHSSANTEKLNFSELTWKTDKLLPLLMSSKQNGFMSLFYSQTI